MPSEKAWLALSDIRNNIRLALRFTAGIAEAEFLADIRTAYAVTRCLEIISEAVRRLPQDIRDQHPGLPWRAIMGAGNIYPHYYDNVAEAFVWRTAQTGLGPLLDVVEHELARMGPAAAG